jgi:hypothetical protein
MPLPSNVEWTPQAIESYLTREYSKATDAWNLMAVKFAKAYKAASDKQKTVLKAVKARKLEEAQSEQFAYNFIFSILTVGIAGGAGGALARSIFADTQKNAIDAAKQVGQFLVRQGAAPIWDVLDPVKAVRGDIFEPVGPDPFDYYLNLQDNILTQKNILNLAFGAESFVQLPSGGLTRHPSPSPAPSGGASEEFANWFLDTPFIKEKPDALSIDEKQLATNMRLALWIAWAYVRDIGYWYWKWVDRTVHNKRFKDRDMKPHAFIESFDWDAVRRDLFLLGVPEHLITITGATKALGFDVWGFCNWVASPLAPKALFAGLPTQQKGFPLSKDRMAQMSLTPDGWVDSANVNKMP